MPNQIKTATAPSGVGEVDNILKSASQLDGDVKQKITKESLDAVMDLSDMSSKTKDFAKLHDKYINYGEDELKKYMSDKPINDKLDETLRQMENGSAVTKDTAKELERLAINLNKMNSKRLLKRPTNSFLLKIYDPLNSFLVKSKKTGTVISDILDRLEQTSNQLAMDIVHYRNDQKNARMIVKIAMEKSAAADAIARELSTKIKSMEDQGTDPEYIASLKSEVLAPITKRSMNLLEIAQSYAQYIVTTNVLIKLHEKAEEEINQSKSVTVVQFQNAVRIAQGIAAQDAAIKVTRSLRESAAKLTQSNNIALNNSMNDIYDDQQKGDTSIEDMMKNIDDVCNTIETMHKREGETSDKLAQEVAKYHQAADYMQKRINQMKQAEDSKDSMTQDAAQQVLADINKNAGGNGGSSTPEPSADDDAAKE